MDEIITWSELDINDDEMQKMIGSEIDGIVKLLTGTFDTFMKNGGFEKFTKFLSDFIAKIPKDTEFYKTFTSMFERLVSTMLDPKKGGGEFKKVILSSWNDFIIMAEKKDPNVREKFLKDGKIEIGSFRELSKTFSIPTKSQDIDPQKIANALALGYGLLARGVGTIGAILLVASGAGAVLAQPFKIIMNILSIIYPIIIRIGAPIIIKAIISFLKEIPKKLRELKLSDIKKLLKGKSKEEKEKEKLVSVELTKTTMASLEDIQKTGTNLLINSTTKEQSQIGTPIKGRNLPKIIILGYGLSQKHKNHTNIIMEQPFDEINSKTDGFVIPSIIETFIETHNGLEHITVDIFSHTTNNNMKSLIPLGYQYVSQLTKNKTDKFILITPWNIIYDQEINESTGPHIKKIEENNNCIYLCPSGIQGSTFTKDMKSWRFPVCSQNPIKLNVGSKKNGVINSNRGGIFEDSFIYMEGDNSIESTMRCALEVCSYWSEFLGVHDIIRHLLHSKSDFDYKSDNIFINVSMQESLNQKIGEDDEDDKDDNGDEFLTTLLIGILDQRRKIYSNSFTQSHPNLPNIMRKFISEYDTKKIVPPVSEMFNGDHGNLLIFNKITGKYQKNNTAIQSYLGYLAQLENMFNQ